jgi:hypothetical protein
MQVGIELRRYRQQAKDHLLSEQGIALQKLRSIEVKTVLRDIKSNMHFRRFMLWGLIKVEIEWDLLCMAHNLQKLAIHRPPVLLSLAVSSLFLPSFAQPTG